MTIRSLDDFAEFFPPGSILKYLEKWWHSPCPFCLADGSIETIKNNIYFYGTDRLIWYQAGPWCRFCALAGRGNGNGFYTYDQLAQRLRVDIGNEFDTEMSQVLEENPLTHLWDETIVNLAHSHVDRSFWYRFGWTDEVINRFRLGKRTLYQSDGEVNCIPMEVTHVSDEEENSAIKGLFYVSGRREGIPPKRTPGSSRSFYWRIPGNDTASKIVILAEGEKDAVTASFLFPAYAVIATFGATTWTKQKTEALANMGFKEIWIFGDNDLAGQAMSRNAALWASSLGITAKILTWDNNIFAPGYDVTDVLQHHGKVFTEEYILSHLEHCDGVADAGVTRAIYMTDISSVVNYSQLEFIEQEELRGEGENSLRFKIKEFLSSYENKKKRNRGVLQLLQAPPGSGKTHTLIQISEEEAQKEMAVRYEQQEVLKQNLADLLLEIANCQDYEEKAQLQKVSQTIQKKIDDFSVASVAWYGQYKDGYSDLLATGANPDLWFNFEARHPGNCANYDTVVQLANNNHDIGSYCQLVCPFKRDCLQSGYLSQDAERRKKPVTFFRFQHMQSARSEEYTLLNVVDENPGGLIDNSPVVFKSKDVYPFNEGWELDIEDRYTTAMIELFASSVRAAMNYNIGKTSREEGGILSGAAFLKLVDNNIKGASNGAQTLQSVCEHMDDSVITNYYQPTFLGGDVNNIKKRCVPQLLATVSRELMDYVENPDNRYPSCIHLVDGCLELYAQQPLKFSSNVPMIVADSTALPLLYNAMFKREVEVYAPRVKNENAEIMVVHGSDWTKSQISQEIGRQIAMARSGELDEGIYDRRIVRDAITIISGLAQKHKSLLVVTHKNIRELFEKLMEGKYENVAWGHYGALRGSNSYTDFEAVVLIGAFRIPYDVMYRRISAWAWLLGFRDELTTETVIKPLAYDGQSSGHGYRTFENWFADAFVNMVEQGEIIQSAERIRPHSTKEKKYVYIVASRPAVSYVTSLVSKNEFMKQFIATKEKELEKFLREYYNEYQSFPTYRTLADKFATSNSVIQKIKQRIEGEINEQ